MNELKKLLLEYIEKEKELSHVRPFLSEYEEGIRDGKTNVLDDIEDIIKKLQ